MSTVPRSLTVADRLRGLGLSFIPCARGTKRPLVEWLEFQHRYPTDAEIAAWCRRPVNFGIVCGAISGLVAVDCDDVEAIGWSDRNLPKTPMRCHSGGGGVHLFFKHPGGVVGSPVGVQPIGCARKLKLDIRADGAYILAPGSIHPNGLPYRAPVPWPRSLDVLPTFDPAWLREAEPPVPPSRVRRATTVPIVARAQAYADAVPPAVQGQGGDKRTHVLACAVVRGFDLDDASAVAAMRPWNARCRPPWRERDLRAKIRNARRNGREPFGGRL